MNNIATDYTSTMINYEKQLDGAYKKSNGIFYTDLSLASKMIEELDVSKISLEEDVVVRD